MLIHVRLLEATPGPNSSHVELVLSQERRRTANWRISMLQVLHAGNLLCAGVFIMGAELSFVPPFSGKMFTRVPEFWPSPMFMLWEKGSSCKMTSHSLCLFWACQGTFSGNIFSQSLPYQWSPDTFNLPTPVNVFCVWCQKIPAERYWAKQTHMIQMVIVEESSIQSVPFFWSIQQGYHGIYRFTCFTLLYQ